MIIRPLVREFRFKKPTYMRDSFLPSFGNKVLNRAGPISR